MDASADPEIVLIAERAVRRFRVRAAVMVAVGVVVFAGALTWTLARHEPVGVRVVAIVAAMTVLIGLVLVVSMRRRERLDGVDLALGPDGRAS